MAIEQLRNIGGVIYIDRGDGRLIPVSQGQLDDSGPATPPRADAPMSVSEPRNRSIGQRASGLLGDIPNMLNGTGIPERLAVANDFFNPVAGVYGAMDASKQMLAPNRTGYERATSLAEMLTELAGAGLAGADLARGGVAGAAAVADSLLAGTPATRSMADTADLTAREALAYARSVGEGDLAFLRGGGVPQSLGAASRVGNVDPAVSRGQGILDMLKSGRGADVTDEMLDMGDPVANARLNQYLYQNYDLPMDQASRMERAGEMGMVNDVMHGTPYADISALKPSEFGAVGSGVYVATNPKVAGDYARGYGFMTPQKTFEYNGDRFTEGGNVMPLRTTENLQPFSDWTDARMADLKRQGLYGSSYKADDAASSAAAEAGFEGVQARQGNAVIFNPANIRSRFARFDPRLSHLRNLSAAAAGTGLLGTALQSRDRQEM